MELKAVFVDAAGTLMKPREPVGVTYARQAQLRGHDVDPVDVQIRFRAAMRDRRSPTDGMGDGRAFWHDVVTESIGAEDRPLSDTLYAWYAEPRAWWVDVEALQILGLVARQGVRLGIISNWDLRLRALYTRFALDRMFPVLICSSEIGFEKPDPRIFHVACEVAGVRPGQAAHIGDDPERDVSGANAAGLVGLIYDEDLGWTSIRERLARLRSPLWR